MSQNLTIRTMARMMTLSSLLIAILAIGLVTPSVQAGEFPSNYYFPNLPKKLSGLEGKAAPAINADRWIGDAQTLDSLKGKVVVVDFWATWCGPCMRAIPKNVSLQKKYGKDGLTFIGIHDSKNGVDRMSSVAKQMKINYPLGVDKGGRMVKAYGLGFWPTYVVIDRKGVVRAAGLVPDKVESVVKKLLAEEGEGNGDDNAPAAPPVAEPEAPTPSSMAEFPQEWYFAKLGQPVRSLEGKPAPELALRDWIGNEATLESLRGNIVVVDFWATWCGPCMRAIPHNIEMVDKYGPKGVKLIGIHDSKRGYDRMASAVESRGINYPVAIDDNGASVRDYKVSFWPTYVVIDKKGIVRASGLRPDAVDKVVDALLKEGGASASASKSMPAMPLMAPGTGSKKTAKIPSRWLEGSASQRARLSSLMAADAPPALNATEWLNSESLDLDALKGKVVMIDFWATWCGPCIASVPHVNELQSQYGDQGLVVIGVCHPRGVEKMAAAVKQHGIEYPVCADTNGSINKAYQVNGYPDYYFIDRSGKLRVADCANGMVDEAIQALLAE